MVTTTTAGEADAIVQFQVIGGDALFNDSNFNVLAFQAATHRQIWMRCDTGQFADKRVRQALALTFDREQMITTLFRDKADLANDHVIAPFYPFFFDGTPQRTKDIDKAKALLAEVGTPNIKAVLHAGDLQEIPQLAQIIQVGAKEAGFDLEIAVESLDTFYGAQWCPEEPADPPCSGAAELGIVDYGHRATPDVYLNAALATGGVWNSSQYSSAEFDGAFKEYQESVGVEAQIGGLREDPDHPERGRPGRAAVLLQLPVRPLEQVPGRAGERAGADVPRPGLSGLNVRAPGPGPSPVREDDDSTSEGGPWRVTSHGG